jgi:DNA-binding NarL/FixJ family response regulator
VAPQASTAPDGVLAARLVLASAGRGLLVDALALVLGPRPDIDLVCEPVHTLSAAVAACSGPLPADVLVLDVDGASPSRVIEFLRTATRSCRSTRLLLLVGPGTEHEVLLVEYLEAGAAGFLHRAAHVDDVIAGIHEAASGETVIDPAAFIGLLRRAHEERESARSAAHLLRTLTPREFEILGYVVEGLGNDEIGARLHISTRTVATHVQNLFRKLDVHSRVQALVLLNRSSLRDGLDQESSA